MFIHYMNKKPNSTTERSLTLNNDIQQIARLAEFTGSIAEDTHMDNALAMGINLALEEAITNVIMYAYPKGEGGQVQIDAVIREGSLDFIISDTGIPFDPTAAPEADTSLGVEERPIGGLGIFLVRKIMDKVSYRRENGKNILSMTKFL
jgi:anti-sigma regulatory factor (Ser/Thr protein kinase)